MLQLFQLVGDQLPVVCGHLQGYEGTEVEVPDGHIVDSFGSNAAVGTRQPYLTHFLQHMQVFFIQHILVEQEGDGLCIQAVPHRRGEGP